MQPLMQLDLEQSAVAPKGTNAPALWRSGTVVRLAFSLWATVLLVICIRGLLNARTNSVYPIFAGAARSFLAGADLYAASGSPYRYSPLVAGLLVPFSLWPDHLG